MVVKRCLVFLLILLFLLVPVSLYSGDPNKDPLTEHPWDDVKRADPLGPLHPGTGTSIGLPPSSGMRVLFFNLGGLNISIIYQVEKKAKTETVVGKSVSTKSSSTIVTKTKR